VIQKIWLTNFRNFGDRVVEFSEGITVVCGANASGKTNVLEALWLLSTGKSFKARIEEEMISHGEEIGRVKGRSGGDTLEVVLTRGEINVGTSRSERVARKRLLVNGVGKRLVDFAGNLKLVLFGPWDLELVVASPSVRRRFLDGVLGQVDGEYRRALLSYEKGLRQRNRLLVRIREEGISRSHLMFWDRLLIKNGDYIGRAREELLKFVNGTGDFNGQDFSIEYDGSLITEARLEQYTREEVAAGTTLVGPHRDDFCFRLKKNGKARELDRYGSRGEQRMGVLWLKLSELAFIEEKTGAKPTLLLDDVFSELDEEHRGVVTEFSRKQQTVITTTEVEYMKELGSVEKIEI